MPIELRHLRYFIAVAEERHFGHAAQRLHIAQPPLSRQIQALEAELGTQLFSRAQRRVELTAAGRAFLAEVPRVFDALELARTAARRADSGESGRIAVGYPSSLVYSGVTDLLRAYRTRFPHVAIALHQLSPNEQLEALRDGRIDVGFIRSPPDEPSIASERVRREELLVALPADHPMTRRKRIALKQLAHEPFVTFPRARGPAFYDQLMALCHEAGFSPRVVQEAAQLDMISLVEVGFGVAIVPASVREMHRDGVVLRPIVGAPHTELRVAWMAASASPVLRGFLEIVRSRGVRREVVGSRRRATTA